MKRFLSLSFMLILVGSVSANNSRTPQGDVTKVVLTGTVFDSNHAVIADGELLARSLEGKEFWTRTNTEGFYKFVLPPGTYKVEANAPGFCPRRVDLFRLSYPRGSEPLSRPGTMRPLDFTLDVTPGDRACAQKTMIEEKRPTRKPELFRSIAE